MKLGIKFIGLVFALLIVISGCTSTQKNDDSVTGGSVVDTDDKVNDNVNVQEPTEEESNVQEERIIVNLNKFEYLLEEGEERIIDSRNILVKEINDNGVVLEVDGEQLRLPIHQLRTIKGIDVDLRIVEIVDDNNFILEFKRSQKSGKNYRYIFSANDKVNFDGKIINVELRGNDKAVIDVDGEKATFTLDNSKDLNGLRIEIYDIVNDGGIDYDYVYMLVRNADPIDDRNND